MSPQRMTCLNQVIIFIAQKLPGNFCYIEITVADNVKGAKLTLISNQIPFASQSEIKRFSNAYRKT